MIEVIENSKSIASESYRTLRTNVQFTNIDQNIQVIAVTSATPGEGKTTTVINLAATFAQVGKRTLIIDADLRKPSIHKEFDFARVHGLSSVLLGEQTFASSVQKVADQENLDILVCGPIPPNPAEILASQRMNEFIHSLRSEYDVILIDSPPTLAVTDMQILSQIVDGVILVTRYNQVKKDQVIEAKKRLETVNAHIMGIVLNHVERNNHDNGYYYYYYAE